jgi:hypothetical protein
VPRATAVAVEQATASAAVALQSANPCQVRPRASDHGRCTRHTRAPRAA